MASSAIALSLILALNQSVNFANAAGNPSPSPKSKASASPSATKGGQPSAQSNGNSQNSQSNSPAASNSSANANPKGNGSEKAPAVIPSPAANNSSANANPNGNGSEKAPAVIPSPAANNSSANANPTSASIKVATKSDNPKLNPSANNSKNLNASADKAVTLAKSKSPDCTPAKAAKLTDPKDVCSDFIVVFEPGYSRTNSNKLISASGAKLLRTFTRVFNGALVNGPLAKMQALAKNPNVLVVEDDLEVTVSAIQTPAPWGLDRLDQQLLPLTTIFDDRDVQGANTYSYVVDTGIDASNIDFEGRVAAGYTAILDGRGSADCNGHGTHVAGTIGGKTYGVAKRTNLIPVRVLDCAGSGSYSSVISGLDWIAANYRTGDSAVVNMSLGGPASSTLDGAVRNLISKGISVVVAAGNSSADACNYSPARVLDAITVGATTSGDSRASYSNFGSCLDVFAPGTSITSTWLGANGISTISGTSMASPHVAGVVARFVGQYSGLTPAQVANSIKTSSTKNLVSSAGTGSPNQLAFLFVVPDTTTVAPIDTSPTFKKNTPRGRSK